MGNLYCKVCGQKFQTTTNYLSVAADVYSDWIDACEDVAKEAAEHEATESARDREFSDYATARVGEDEDDDYQ